MVNQTLPSARRRRGGDVARARHLVLGEAGVPPRAEAPRDSAPAARLTRRPIASPAAAPAREGGVPRRRGHRAHRPAPPRTSRPARPFRSAPEPAERAIAASATTRRKGRPAGEAHRVEAAEHRSALRRHPPYLVVGREGEAGVERVPIGRSRASGPPRVDRQHALFELPGPAAVGAAIEPSVRREHDRRRRPRPRSRAPTCSTREGAGRAASSSALGRRSDRADPPRPPRAARDRRRRRHRRRRGPRACPRRSGSRHRAPSPRLQSRPPATAQMISGRPHADDVAPMRAIGQAVALRSSTTRPSRRCARSRWRRRRTRVPPGPPRSRGLAAPPSRAASPPGEPVVGPEQPWAWRRGAHTVPVEGGREDAAVEHRRRLGLPVTAAVPRSQEPGVGGEQEMVRVGGLMASPSAPPMKRPSLTGSQRAPWSRERKQAAPRAGSWASARAEQRRARTRGKQPEEANRHGGSAAGRDGRGGRATASSPRRARPGNALRLARSLSRASVISAIREPFGPIHEFLVSGYLSVYDSGSCAARSSGSRRSPCSTSRTR
jgi:hypothetical protein